MEVYIAAGIDFALFCHLFNASSAVRDLPLSFNGIFPQHFSSI